MWCPEKCPQEKSPPEKCLRENCPPENYPPEISPPKNCPPEKSPPENCPPGKLFHLIFVAFNIILQFLIFKLFTVASFRGVSSTLVVSIIDLLVTVVNGSNECHKKLLLRCCVGHRFTSGSVR